MLFPIEVEPLRDLGEALDEMLAESALVSDADYLADPRWSQVIQLARVALEVMNRSA